ncbi:MAG TPA: adenosine deaminase [Xanthomonadales bacterium]|nr:adenosine deaminase [Xanthomonadales bacterium]
MSILNQEIIITKNEEKLHLIDLHRHLDGSVRLSTVLDLARQYGIELPASDIESLRPYVEVSGSEAGLMAFIARFEYLTAVMVNAEACRRIAYENVLDAAEEGIDYIELRFSPVFMAETHQLDPADVVDAVIDGVSEGVAKTNVNAQLIGILSRSYGQESCMEELSKLLRRKDDLVAIDLAGNEKEFPASLFVDHFKLVREAGLSVTVHAGEADGPHSVWSAINNLGATRIGHGFRSIEDEGLVEHLAEKRIGLEVCLTSNLHIGAIESYELHPAKALFDAGVLMNLNTDDPGISGIDLPHEYSVAADTAGFVHEDKAKLMENAAKMAFKAI